MRVDCSITENYFKEKNRLCENCDSCIFNFKEGQQAFGCNFLENINPELAIETVQKWSDEHQPTTNLDYLLKHFPNTKLDEDGTPAEICPDSIGLPLADGMVCKGNAVDCKKCWSRLYEEK